MTDTVIDQTIILERGAGAWVRLKTHRNWLGFWFMLPAMAFLIFFLAYPLGLGVWISFTDARIGRPGVFIGTENYEWLWGDSIFWLSVFNTLLYTTIASAIKFAVGLYLALLLNENMPFKAMLRAMVLGRTGSNHSAPDWMALAMGAHPAAWAAYTRGWLSSTSPNWRASP